MKNRFKSVGIAIVLALIFYPGSYLFLTVHGQIYQDDEPDQLPYIGNGMTLHWDWVPLGFYHKGKENLWLMEFYSPLYTLDKAHWHHGMGGTLTL